MLLVSKHQPIHPFANLDAVARMPALGEASNGGQRVSVAKSWEVASATWKVKVF